MTTSNDLLIFDKYFLTSSNFGHIQDDTDFYFSIDKSPSSYKCKILNKVRKPIEPNTICYLQYNNTWWVVDEDEVELVINEDNNDLYIHDIQLIGAEEMFNMKKLENCGFNKGRYTYDKYIKRMFNLSSLERFTFNKSIGDIRAKIEIEYGSYINKDKKVKNLITYQNYTLGSALKEFFDGEDLVYRISFEYETKIDGSYKINKMIIKLIPKTGLDNEPIDISELNENYEKSKASSDNFSSAVLSNIENSISSENITFPNTGYTYLSSSAYKSDRTNSYIQLPNKVSSVNYIDFQTREVGVGLSYKKSGDMLDIKNVYPFESLDNKKLYRVSKQIYDELIKTANEYKDNGYSIPDSFYKEMTIDNIFIIIFNNYILRLYNGSFISYKGMNNVDYSLRLMNKKDYETYKTNNADELKNILYWEQGNDKIYGFDWIVQYFLSLKLDRIENYNRKTSKTYMLEKNGSFIEWDIIILVFSISISTSQTRGMQESIFIKYSVNYTGYNDIVLDDKDYNSYHEYKYYNQNGKMIDSIKASKYVDSYLYDLKSNELIRKKTTLSFDDIYKVGTRFIDGNDIYIVESVSISCNNEVYVSTYTLAKERITKNRTIRANSKIIDYQIPQQNNIKRTSVFTQYLRFTNTKPIIPSIAKNIITPIFLLINFGKYDYCSKFIFTILSKIGYTVGDYKYFILRNYTNIMHKSIIISIYFTDNNIIDYAKSIDGLFWKGDWTNGLFNQGLYNTPISYVDSYGELESIEMKFIKDEISTEKAIEYDKNYNNGLDSGLPYEQYPLIPKEYYDSFNDTQEYYFIFKKNNYDKDGLEIPIFELQTKTTEEEGFVFADDFFKYMNSEKDVEMKYEAVLKYATITNKNVSDTESGRGTVFITTQLIDKDKMKIRIDFGEASGYQKGDNIAIFASYWSESEGRYIPRFIFGINNANVVDENQIQYIEFYAVIDI